jgi:type I restriction enzyme S subunit
VVRKGDLVVNRLWARFGAYGVSDLDGIISPAYWVLVVDRRRYEPRFLHYLLQSAPYRAEIWRRSKDLPPNGFDLPWEQFRGIRVPIADLDGQRRIADYLDTETARVEAVVQKKRRLIELLDERFESEVRLVLRGLAVEWLPLKRRWQVIDCKHRTPVYVDEGYPVVSPGDAMPGRLDLSRCHRFVDEEDYRDLAEPPRCPTRGCIIYSRNASIGIASFVDTDAPFCMGQDVCLVTSRDQNQLFLTYVLNTVGVDQLDEAKIGSTFNRINVAQILDLRVPCPDGEVQYELARRFDALDAARVAVRSALERQIELLLEHRQAVITAAVTRDLAIPEVGA